MSNEFIPFTSFEEEKLFVDCPDPDMYAYRELSTEEMQALEIFAKPEMSFLKKLIQMLSRDETIVIYRIIIKVNHPYLFG